MKITVGRLRKIVREGVFSDWMTTAGMYAGGSGISDPRKGTETPPPGLGSPEEQDTDEEENDKEPQEKSQLAQRYADRHPKG